MLEHSKKKENSETQSIVFYQAEPVQLSLLYLQKSTITTAERKRLQHRELLTVIPPKSNPTPP